MPIRRNIVKIDEEKCDGCGLCVDACAEGAIQIIDGKAKLVSEVYCDGLGACLGDCPQGAITIEVREAEAFDEAAVEKHLGRIGKEPVGRHAGPEAGQNESRSSVDGTRTGYQPVPHREADFSAAARTGYQPVPRQAGGFKGCPGSLTQMLRSRAAEPAPPSSDSPSIAAPQPKLANWPVQLNLAPVNAPYFDGARLLIAADCVPFAFADFHRQFLDGRVLLIGCPKLDNAQHYREKLAAIFEANDIRSVEIVHMEVPCCFGLVNLVQSALGQSGREIPMQTIKIGLRGEVLSRHAPEVAGRGPRAESDTVSTPRR